ncbi:hypothetical protein L596_000741 [Steinernema carpocapsae]|uniref:DBF4-type domain-containing protein n=1 Tax=Steinernema carpocapsae TaxID=34508 RepID=A0A4U8ULD0_STECR|nr:hypothetical protein L596_000741 [Steinernema carpocapsae]
MNASGPSNSRNPAVHGINTPGMKRRLPSSTMTGTVEKKARLDLQALSKYSRGPWEHTTFKIDIRDKKTAISVRKDIIYLAGQILDDFSATKPHFLISDDPLAERCELGNVPVEIRKGLGSFLREAVDQKIRVKSTKCFMENIEAYKKKFAFLCAKPLTSRAPETKKPVPIKIRKLRKPFMKIQGTEYAPTYKEFVNLPFKLFGGDEAGKSAFHEVTPGELERRAVKKSPRKPVKRHENRRGQCEICQVACQNLEEHYQTAGHVKRVSQPDFYSEVDALCGSFLDEIKVAGYSTLPPRERTPEHESPAQSGSLSGFMTKYYGQNDESD